MISLSRQILPCRVFSRRVFFRRVFLRRVFLRRTFPLRITISRHRRASVYFIGTISPIIKSRVNDTTFDNSIHKNCPGRDTKLTGECLNLCIRLSTNRPARARYLIFRRLMARNNSSYFLSSS